MRIFAAVGLLLLGAVTALAATALHGLWWGLLLGVAATAATTVALPARWWARLSFGIGWSATVGYLSVPRGEGDYVIGQDLAGYLLLGTGLAVVVVSVSTLPAPRRVRGSDPADS